jgi:hypothetical protein
MAFHAKQLPAMTFDEFEKQSNLEHRSIRVMRSNDFETLSLATPTENNQESAYSRSNIKRATAGYRKGLSRGDDVFVYSNNK